jgi:deoxyribodipyrimidine photolyase-related protein
MKQVSLVFPHQLFKKVVFDRQQPVLLVEEYLFFRQYPFHKQKLALHRATMHYYRQYLQDLGYQVWYIDSTQAESDVRKLVPWLQTQGFTEISYIDPTDNWLHQRLIRAAQASRISLLQHDTQLFLNSPEVNKDYFGQRKKFFQTDFYIYQRKRLGILLEVNQQPVGGRWSFDTENRLKYPKGARPPVIAPSPSNVYYEKAVRYVQQSFGSNPGSLASEPIYPLTHGDAESWLQGFIAERLDGFGPYEDAIVAAEHFLHHSVLTPYLNIGLLTPKQVVDAVLGHAETHQVHLPSIEGFVRQIIGWREFMRAVYELKGAEARTKNYWGFTRKIPAMFWDGTTGIPPLDVTIKKVLKTGYAHHIERLMVLGSFMLLCEFDPDEVYRWFMALFIDAYDWVMVPNIYSMSQFADGSIMATKPYISGSNYLMKMSNYQKGPWQEVWDALFWRFIDVHRHFFVSNPRLGMLVRNFDKMPDDKKKKLLETAEQWLTTLDKNTPANVQRKQSELLFT